MARALPLVFAASSLGAPSGRAQEACEQTWRLVETLRIGSLDGDDALAPVLDVAVGPDALVYVTQQFTSVVTVFDRDGGLARTIGRAGQGPGEFERSAIRVGWKADSLWVVDAYSTQLFGPEDRFARRTRFATVVPSESSHLLPGVPLSKGLVLPRRSTVGDMTNFVRAEQLAVVRVDDSGEIVDTIAMVPPSMLVELPDGFAMHPLGSAVGAFMPYAIAPDGLSIVSVGETRYTRRDPTFDLLRISVEGDTLMRRPVPFDPRPITGSDRDWLANVFANHMAGDYMSGPGTMRLTETTKERRRRDARGLISFPVHHPPVRQLVAGSDGTIWVLRELQLPDLIDRWEVYGTDGALRGIVLIDSGRAGTIPWSPRLRVHSASGTEVWGTTIDDFEVPYIHRYRVDRACREGVPRHESIR